jgi:predicted transcriptional regulator
MSTLNGQTPAAIAHDIVEEPSFHQHVRTLAGELGVPEAQVQSYLKQQAYRKAYAKRRNEEMKLVRSLIRSDSSIAQRVRTAVSLVEVK